MDAFYRQLLRFRLLVVLVAIGLVLAAAFGAQKLVFKSDYRVFFGKENPQLKNFERMQKTFAKSDNALFILAPQDGNVFSPEVIEAMAWLTEQSWQLPYSTRVDSITNFQHTYAEEDDMIVEDLVFDPEALDDAEVQRIRQIALNEPLIVNRLLSPDARVAAVNVNVQLPGINLVEEVPEVVVGVRALRDQLVERYPQIDVYLSGMVMMNNTFAEASLNDSATLVPLMFLAVILLIGILVRTIGGLVATLVIIITSIAGAMGLAGWYGLFLTGPSASAPTIILTLAVADCVHILTTFYHEMRSGVEQRQALINSLKINTQPVILTSVTTAIGFLTMNFSDSPPFADLGNIVAVGVMLACVLALTLFPAMLALMPLKATARPENHNTAMDRIACFVICRRKPLLWVSVTLVLITIAQIPRNELNDDFVKYFDQSVEFRQAADFSDQHLTGMGILEIELSSGESSGINNPTYLQQAEDLANWLRQQPEVVHVNSLTDIMKRLNRNMHGDDPSYHRLPDNRELAAQYLLLYEMSLPYGLDLNNQINVDKSAIRLIATCRNLTSKQNIDLERRTKQWLAENTPELKSTIASPSLMFAHIGKRNIKSMLSGTLTALVLISVLLGCALRSLKFGLISLAPNLIPAGLAFGLWGMWVGEVGLALSVVTGMTLGIIVDDTVHFLSKYLHARRERNDSTQQAIVYAFHSVGKALWITTLVLSVGFLILSMSTFKVNADMGLLTAITIVIALVVDFILLPILILLFDKESSPTSSDNPADSAIPRQEI
ncbi:RND family transporter [Motiliproteus coralliicola]|uniref:RND family transporter n=1 Tax=Motiliproteus coralliicola TaxID=2283196 RepID=A0A369WL24_9GAMM|nr:MMPL family transporter [Motiliproteus coralliicola]RDE22778.1 RND family transporter [Motiliproteus coralliicola]